MSAIPVSLPAPGEEIELVNSVGRWPAGQRAELVDRCCDGWLLLVDARFSVDGAKHDVFFAERDDVA